jgi:hypothetical protein
MKLVCVWNVRRVRTLMTSRLPWRQGLLTHLTATNDVLSLIIAMHARSVFIECLFVVVRRPVRKIGSSLNIVRFGSLQ